MPATSASHLIFFIAAMILAAGLSGVFIASIQELSDSIRSRGEGISEELKSDIEIINDPACMPYNSTNKTLIVYVQNIGKRTLNYKKSIVLINGTAYTNLTYKLLDGGSEWLPQTTLQITVGNVTLSKNVNYRLKVIVEGKATSVIDFKVT